jgi:hypothetical protein
MASSTPGRLSLVKMSGTTTAFTGEATTALVANQVYQITNAVKQVWDQFATITVKNGGTPVDPVADPYTINRLTGSVSFTNVASRTITVDGHYLPMSTIAKATDFTYNIDRPPIDDTTYDSPSGYRENVAGLGSDAVTVGKNWESVSAPLLETALKSGAVLVLELYSNRNNAPDVLVWALPTKAARSVKVTDLVKSSLEFVGTIDADGRSNSL